MDEDKPGLGQYYCVTCARYFISLIAIETHKRTKEHKKRFKVVTTEVPYSKEEAEKAGGLFHPQTTFDKMQAKIAFNQSATIAAELEEQKRADDGVEDVEFT